MSPDKIVVFCCICCILSESGMIVAARMIILVTRMVEPWIRMRILVTRMIEPWTRTIAQTDQNTCAAIILPHLSSHDHPSQYRVSNCSHAMPCHSM